MPRSKLCKITTPSLLIGTRTNSNSGSATGSLTTQQLANILEYHVINGTVGYSTLLTSGLANESLPTVSGGELNILVENGKVFVNSAQVIITDIIVANGVMHVLDKYVLSAFFGLSYFIFLPVFPSRADKQKVF